MSYPQTPSLINSDKPIYECQRPCDPEHDCPHCDKYWQRMRDEGFWIDGQGWTAKGMKEMTK